MSAMVSPKFWQPEKHFAEFSQLGDGDDLNRSGNKMYFLASSFLSQINISQSLNDSH
jgi:hypothetical protein